MEDTKGIKIKINKKDIKMWIWMVFLTFPHLKPPYVSLVPIFDTLFNIFRVLSVFMIFLWMVLQNKYISKLSIGICLLQSYIAVITFIRGGAFYDCVLNAISISSVVLLYEVSFNSKSKKVFY